MVQACEGVIMVLVARETKLCGKWEHAVSLQGTGDSGEDIGTIPAGTVLLRLDESVWEATG